MTVIRRGGESDLPAVAAIQAASPGAARWDPADYLNYDFRVAMGGNSVAGFLVARALLPDEMEILNLAVHPDARRQGVARALFEGLIRGFSGSIFLEVRESNAGAHEFYKALGFHEVTRRPRYYDNPLETAIVMKFHSC
jgi:[ribosomal protein S18]-alanine N-acetyltransferase